jgi:hypothetical protein
MSTIELSAGPVEYTDTGGSGPVLVLVHGRRLADLLPNGRLVEVEDSCTLVPLDQPARLAQLVRELTHGRPARTAPGAGGSPPSPAPPRPCSQA